MKILRTCCSGKFDFNFVKDLRTTEPKDTDVTFKLWCKFTKKNSALMLCLLQDLSKHWEDRSLIVH